MLIYEYRIPVPMTKMEYRIGQRYTTIVASLEETGGGEGVRIEVNEPYDGGQYTKKHYYLKTRMPRFIQFIAPEGSLELLEESWNIFPSTRTAITNPGYMKDDFFILIDTFIKDGYKETRHNVFGLTDAELAQRKVIDIDISSNKDLDRADYFESEDPSKFRTKKANPTRGPLIGSWIKYADPVITVYKLVRVKFKWWGLQHRVEKNIVDGDVRIFRLFNRKVFCTLDEFCDYTLDDILRMEKEAEVELEKRRNQDLFRGRMFIS